MSAAPNPATGAISLTVAKGGARLDRYLSEQTGVTRSQVQRSIDAGAIRVNSKIAKAGHKLEMGDLIEGELHPPEASALTPEPLPLTVVYEDDDLLVVDKPAGLTVHPAPGHTHGTLVNALLARYPQLDGADALRPGIVHRLDKDTSGLLLVAKHVEAHEDLAHQFRNRTVVKRYAALLAGHLSPERGAVEAPIGRDPRYRQRMAVVERGRPSRTQYQVVEYIGGYTLVEATLETGRTHQIRVHFTAIGHPVVGDALYGREAAWCPRQFLHAQTLGFRRPSDGEYIECTSELPADLQQALDWLRTHPEA